jgi:hypothetical protein
MINILKKRIGQGVNYKINKSHVIKEKEFKGIIAVADSNSK